MRPQTEFVLPEAEAVADSSAAEVVTSPEPEPVIAAEPEPEISPEAASEAATDAVPDPVADVTTGPASDPAAFSGPAMHPEASSDPAMDDAAADAALTKALTEDLATEVPQPVMSPEQNEAADTIPAEETAAKDPEPAVPDVSDPEEDEDEDLDAYAFPAPGAPPNGAYAMDESVLSILREEAEREALARRGMASPLESQPDLGVDTAMPDRQTAAALAALETSDDTSARPAARRDLLPDVEEINSTLRPAETGPESRTDVLVLGERKVGFRSGFLMVMTIAIIGAGVYTLEPRISTLVPALAGPLETYVGGVDALRQALDGIMRSATVALNGG